MKKAFKSLILLVASALLLAGCAKEIGNTVIGEGDTMTFSVVTEDVAATKAVADKDGAAAGVNHWVMEVLDADGDVFARKDENGETGVKTHTFQVKLVKGQTYTALFWADTKGSYNTDSLTKVKLVKDDDVYEGNKDSRDAFSAVVTGFEFTGASSQNITLKRPFAQMNIIFTDLDSLYKTMGKSETEYAKFKPCSLQVLANVPTQFNVQTQTASEQAAMTIWSSKDYKDNYDAHGTEATIFMDYFLATADSKDLVDINFNFYSKGKLVTHDFTSVPFQRNYRTNIKGELMSAGATWNVTINPDWSTPDFDVPFLVTSSITEAQNYIAPSTSGSQEAKVVKVADDAVKAGDVQDDATYGKVVKFTLKQTSPSEVSFQLPAITVDPTASWVVTYESNYPTKNVSIDAPEGTKVVVEAPNSHVKVTGTSYKQITALTSANSLVIPEGCEVETLVIKQGGLEIHGTVGTVVVEGTAENVFVRECEGLSESVYNTLKPYLAKGYEGVAKGTTPETYDVILTIGAKIGDKEYKSLNAALAEVKDGQTITLTKHVDTPASVGAIANVNGKTFTIKGEDKASSVLMCGNGAAGGEGACDYRFEGASVTFENLTFAQTSGDANFLGLVRPAKLTFDGCIFKGRTSYWGNDCTIKNSTFEHADAYDYCMWTWGCASMTIQNTVFNTQGKAIKMYGAGTCTLNVEGCTFNSNGQHSGADKPAIAINTGDYTTDYTVNITNCTQTGFVAGATGSAMFGSDVAKEVQGNLDVYVDGVQVWKDGAIVKAISTPVQMKAFADYVNYGSGSVYGEFSLEADVNLSGISWEPVGQTGKNQFLGTFDGKNHTISNLTINNTDASENCATGLFGWLNTATVKNVKVDTANVSGHHNVGVIAGYMEANNTCTIENCQVSGATVSCTHVNSNADGDKCGGIVGFAGNDGSVVSNCTVSNSTISAGRDAGQVAGAAKIANVSDCSATEVTVSSNGTSTGANIRNEVIGREM